MTIEQRIKHWLMEHGLLPDQAEQVMASLKAEYAASDGYMQDRWKDDMEDYPRQLLAVLLLSARRLGLAWIAANLPKAWFRPMFED